jgi:hypothetical protein
VSGPAADPERDGISNFMEYALGLEPTRSDGPGLRIIRSADEDMQDGSVVVEFTHPNVLTDVEFDWEESSDLVHWTLPQTPPQLAPSPVQDAKAFWTVEHARFLMNKSAARFVRLVAKPRLP